MITLIRKNPPRCRAVKHIGRDTRDPQSLDLDPGKPMPRVYGPRSSGEEGHLAPLILGTLVGFGLGATTSAVLILLLILPA
jgi:hypothetical protein